MDEVYDAMRRWSSDFMITVGFDVLPSHAVTIPRRAAFNFHPSALDVTVGGWSRVEHSKGGAVLVVLVFGNAGTWEMLCGRRPSKLRC